MARLTREESKQKIREKKIKRSFRVSRFRSIKNFFWWFSGVLSCIALVFGTVFIGVKVIPIKTYTGDLTSEYVSDTIASKSLLDAFLKIDEYMIDDLPIVEKLLTDLQATEVMEGTTVGDLVTIDFDALKGTKLTDIATVFGSSIKITANLENTVGTETLGDFGKLKVISEWEEVPDVEMPATDSSGNIVSTGDGFANNPKLYYYDASGDGASGFAVGNAPYSEPQNEDFKRAFNDDGTRIAPINATLYYARLASVPILDLVDLIDESLSRIYITDLLTALADMDMESDSLIKTIFEGKKISDLDGETEDLLSGVTFDALGGAEMLGPIGELAFFNGWQNVDENEVEIVGGEMKGDGNSALYYYVSGMDDEDNPIYSPAFQKDSNLCVDGVDASTPLYYANLSVVPLLDAVNVLGDSFGRLTMTEVLETFGVEFEEGNIVEKIIGDTTVNGLGSLDAEEILNDLTIDDLGGADMLGDFGNLSIFSTWQEVKVEDKPFVSAGNNSIDTNEHNPKLYYHIADESAFEEIGGEKVYNDTAYARAFDDNGVSYLGDGAHYNETTLYYAKLSVVGFGDMMDLIGDSIMRVGAKELFEEFGMEFESGSLIEEIIGEKTLGELGSITADDIKLSAALGKYDDDNKETYKIILGAMGETFENDVDLEARANEITIADIDSLNPDNIALEIVLPKADNETLHGILNDAVENKGLYGSSDEINIGDLTSLNIDLVKLSTVMTTVDETLEKILVGATSVSDFDDITIGHLSSGLDFNEVKLTDVMEDLESDDMLAKILNDIYGNYENVTVGQIAGLTLDNLHLSVVLTDANEKLQKILVGAVEDKDNFDDITLGDLNGTGFNIDGVLLKDVMDISSTSTLAKILNDIYGNYQNVTVGQIAGLELTNLHLSTVLTEANGKLKTILKGATGNEFDDITLGDLNGTGFNIDGVLLVDVMTLDGESKLAKILDDAYGNYETVTVGQIATLTLDNVKLATVLTPTSSNAKLYDILKEATSETDVNNIKISSLEEFNMDNVSLSTVMTKKGDTYGNDILDALLENKENPVTIANIGTAINDLTLYEVYGESCFTTESKEAVNPEIKFTLTTDAEGKHVYTHDDVNGTYYMHKEDGIWLLLCFEGKDFEDSGALDTDGRPEKYVETDFTIGDLEKGDSLASRVMNATIRQLVDAGMLDIEEPNEELCTLTIAGAIDTLNEILSNS